MRKMIITAVIIGMNQLSTLSSTAQVVEKTFRFEEVDSIELSHGVEFRIVHSDESYAVVKISEAYADYLDVDQFGGDVHIGLDNPPWRLRSKRHFSAVVYTQDVHDIGVSGGSRGTIEGFRTLSDLRIKASGGSRIRTEDDIEVEGNCNLTGSGGSNLDLETLRVESVRVSMSGGSRATLQIRDGGSIRGSLSGGSRIDAYGSDIERRVSTSGGSRVTIHD